MKWRRFVRFLSQQSALVTMTTQVGQSQPASTTCFPTRAEPLKPGRRSSHPALERAREHFVDALRDVNSREAACLTMRISYAPSIEALWHLRSEVFLQIAIHHSQQEALDRLEHLGQHFPTRSPRSCFGALAD